MKMTGTGCHGQDTEYPANLGGPRLQKSYAIGNCREAGRSLLGGCIVEHGRERSKAHSLV
jgi:hypothetical protein